MLRVKRGSKERKMKKRGSSLPLAFMEFGPNFL